LEHFHYEIIRRAFVESRKPPRSSFGVNTQLVPRGLHQLLKGDCGLNIFNPETSLRPVNGFHHEKWITACHSKEHL